MQHAEHFLSRLDRLAGNEVDLALDLYRDSDLLRAILAEASLPDGAERVAISIDDPVLGPFLIVTRDGHFVTCLGRGMRTGSLPVVSRQALDAASRRIDKLREKLVLATRLGEKRGPLKHLLRGLVAAPDRVSRDEFLEVSAWEPLLGPVFMDMYLAMAAELLQQAPLLRRMPLRGAHGDEALHTYWNLIHAAGHFALLGTMGGERDHFLSLTQSHLHSRAAFSYALSTTGVLTFLLKGAWASARLGKVMVADHKHSLVHDGALFEVLDSVFALLAIGCRSSGTRAEIGKALLAAPGAARTPAAKRLREASGPKLGAVFQIAEALLEVPEEELQEKLLRFADAYFTSGPVTDQAVRNELKRTLPLMSWMDGCGDGKKVNMTLHLIAATARGEPEAFYLPKELARAFYQPWEPSFTHGLLRPVADMERAQRRPVSLGRSAPCSCGSGRKAKRCCLAG